jgi:hypothetical protein
MIARLSAPFLALPLGEIILGAIALAVLAAQ